MGPVPIHFRDAINELINEGKISEKQEKVIDYSKYKYSSLKEPNLDILFNNELQVINDTINKLSNLLSKKISEYSHGDIPWKIAENEEPINYEAVFYRDPEYSVREYDD